MNPQPQPFRRIRFWLSLFALAGAVASAPLLASGPGTLKFDQASLEVSEAVGVAIVTVERSQGESGAVSVRYATSDGTATAGADYTATSGTLSWASGDPSPKTFAVPITPDAAAEGSETIHLTLSDPTGGAGIDPARGTAEIVILDQAAPPPGDDGPGAAGSFHFSERSFLTREGNGVAVITVERSGGEHGAVGVTFRTSAGSASPGEDYQETSGSLAWADGDESLRSFSIPILQDRLVEGDETVQLSLSNPTGGASLDADRASAGLTILDDGDNGPGGDDDPNHPAGKLHFDDARFEVVEGETFAVIRVERSRGKTGAVAVGFATSDGSAVAGLDYESAQGTLSWPSGVEGARTFRVAIHADTLREGNETVNLRLTAPTGGATLDAASDTAILTILDDDGSTASCAGDDDTLCLQDDRFSIEGTWRLASGQTGRAHMTRLSRQSGTVWFFDPDNAEVLIKVLDACTFPGHPSFWVFFAPTTDVDFSLRVTDTRTGLTREYGNLLGHKADSVQDVNTFATCN